MKNKGKFEKGFTSIDLSIAMFIIVLFVSLVSSVTYSVYTASTEARRRATSTNYAVTIFEKIGTLSYSAVTGEEALRDIPEIKDIKTSGTETTAYIGESESNYQFKFTLTISETYPNEIKDIKLDIDYRIKAGTDGINHTEFSTLKIISGY